MGLPGVAPRAIQSSYLGPSSQGGIEDRLVVVPGAIRLRRAEDIWSKRFALIVTI